MGYCILKIAGHSETDFKHKKVFAKSQKLLNHQPIFTDVKLEQREQPLSYLWFKRVKIFIVFAFIFTVLFLTTVFGTKINNLYADTLPKQTKSHASLSKGESQQAAIMLYKSAKMYFKSGALDLAQEEITLVLKLYPTNNDALELMHKVLEKQCETKNMNCYSAEEYRKYFETKDKVNDSQ